MGNDAHLLDTMETMARIWFFCIPLLGTFTAMLTHKLEAPFRQKMAMEGMYRGTGEAFDYYFMAAVFWPLWLVGCGMGLAVNKLKHGACFRVG